MSSLEGGLGLVPCDESSGSVDVGNLEGLDSHLVLGDSGGSSGDSGGSSGDGGLQLLAGEVMVGNGLLVGLDGGVPGSFQAADHLARRALAVASLSLAEKYLWALANLA